MYMYIPGEELGDGATVGVSDGTGERDPSSGRQAAEAEEQNSQKPAKHHPSRGTCTCYIVTCVYTCACMIISLDSSYS